MKRFITAAAVSVTLFAAGCSNDSDPATQATIPTSTTPASTIPVATANFAGGLAVGGGFSSLAAWSGTDGTGDDLSGNIDTGNGNSVYSISIPDGTSTPSEPWNRNLQQTLAVTQGNSYKVKFKARSDRSRSINVGIGLNATPFTNAAQSVALTTDWQDYEITLQAANFGGVDNRLFFEFAGEEGLVMLDEVSVEEIAVAAPTLTQVDLPVNFEASTVDYTLTDFGSTVSTLVADPVDSANMVISTVKQGDAETWAGTTIGNSANAAADQGFGSVIPFTATATTMSVRVYSPDAGIPVRLKVERSDDNTVTAETETLTTVANAWETMVFDLSNVAAGTAAFNSAAGYDKTSIFFNFGVDGATAGAKTYLWDDVAFGGAITAPPATSTLLIDYDGTGTSAHTDFGGNASSVVMDPVDASNTVAQSIKTAGAQTWAGTTIGNDPSGGSIASFDAPIFTASDTKMTVRVYSPDAGIPVRLKLEDAADNTISVETEATTTGVNTWETLTFDFSNQAIGTAALDITKTYDKGSIFFNFGTDGATVGVDKTYYWDDVQFIGSTAAPSTTPSTIPPVTSGFDDGLASGGGFSDLAVWSGTDGNGSDLSGNIVTENGNSVYSVMIPAGAATPNDPWNRNLQQTLAVTQGNSYKITFKARSDRNRNINVGIGLNEPPFTNAQQSVGLTSAWEDHEVTLQAANFGGALNRLFFEFAGDEGLVMLDEISVEEIVAIVPTLAQVDLPVNFEGSTVDYTLTDFGNTASTIVADPADASNMVVSTVKANDAETWAGTTIGNSNNATADQGFGTVIPFTATAATISVRVYSPDAGIPVRLKVERSDDPTITAETETLTTVANGWETMVFDLNDVAAGTAAFNSAAGYDKTSIFFNFGVDGATAGQKTYLWDDVIFGGTVAPVTNTTMLVNYDGIGTITHTDFGGNVSSVVADPADASNTVAQSIKTTGAQTWAGTTIGNDPAGGSIASFAVPIFTATDTLMTVRVYSPDAGIPVRLKLEDASDPTITVETEAVTTGVNTWETLTFDFSNQAAGTAALDITKTYDKGSIFFNFGTDGATVGVDKTYFWDDVQFVGLTASPLFSTPTILINYDGIGTNTHTDFGGNASSVVMDPTDASNTVAQSIKTTGAQTWAGTTIGNDPSGGSIASFAAPIFTATDTLMIVRVYSPDAGIPVRLKLEDATDPTITVETEAMTTGVNTWETLVFDFSNQAAGTAALDMSKTYDKGSIFFNFGTDGATVGVDKTYLWDDVLFLGSVAPTVTTGSSALLIDFDGTGANTFTDFGGNASLVAVDPVDASNNVGQSIKTLGAATWAGTTIGDTGGASFAPLPFTTTDTVMTVRVYSPDAGTPVLLKAEDASDGNISVEKLATTTGANTWETLTFDFSSGTPALNIANTYDKVSIFFNFGIDGATVGADKTYFWDDVQFVQ